MAELVFGEQGDAAVGAPSDPTHVRLLDALSARSPRTVGDIAARSGLSMAETMGALGQLELEGRVTERQSGWVAAKRGGEVPRQNAAENS